MTSEDMKMGDVNDPESWAVIPLEEANAMVKVSEAHTGEGSVGEHAEALTASGADRTEQHNAEAAEIAVATQKVMEAYRHVAPSAPEAAVPMVKAIESLDAARAAIGKTDFDAPRLDRSSFNPIELGHKLIREVSGGLVHYERDQGVVVDAKALENHGENLRVNLEQVEAARGHESLDYATSLPKGTLEGYMNPVHPSLDNPHDFDIALGEKSRRNKENAKNTFLGIGGAALTSFSGVFVAGAMGSAAVASGLLLASGGLGAAAFAAYGGKRLYDRYRERKAVKDFSAATIARRMRMSLFA